MFSFSSQIHLKAIFNTVPSLFLQRLFNQVWSLPLLLLQGLLSGDNTKHLMAVKTWFLRGALIDMGDAS